MRGNLVKAKKNMVMDAKKSTIYEPPKVKLINFTTEGFIANSLEFRGDLEWKQDPDPTPKPYDGDIWVQF